MSSFNILPKNRYFEISGSLNVENRSDNKVGMINEVDMTSAVRLRNRSKMVTEKKPSFTALVAKAVSCALQKHPYANRIPLELPFFKRIVQLHQIDMTVAVEKDQPGFEQVVFAGTIRNTDQKNPICITDELRSLATATHQTCPRWKAFRTIVEKVPGRLAKIVLSVPQYKPELWVKHRGGAVMISSPAKYGVDVMMGHWPWPIGISFGLVKNRPYVISNRVEIRPTMFVTMSFDRRLMGGAPAARFFHTICNFLEQAESHFGDEEKQVQTEESDIFMDSKSKEKVKCG